MPKTPNNTKPRKNTTEERLRATPFDQISMLEAEELQIRRATWQRLTEVRVFTELLTKPEFLHVKEELRAGLSCEMANSSKDKIYQVFSEGKGMKLELNETFVKSLGEGQTALLQGAIQAGIQGWGALYWQAKGLLPRSAEEYKETLGTKASSKKNG